MIAVVTGGRDYCDVPRLWRWLDAISAKYGIRHVIDGASDDVTGPYVGWDYWCHHWALARDIPTTRCHADWKGLGRKAGPIRNQRMLDLRPEFDLLPDICLVGPGGRGTADMTARAKAAGILVIEAIPPHGARARVPNLWAAITSPAQAIPSALTQPDEQGG